jgi:hypothetical protein
MSREDYVAVRNFILEALRQTTQLSLGELLERGRMALDHRIKGDVGWCLLRVKEDLIARKLVVIIRGDSTQRLPSYRLNKRRVTSSIEDPDQ